MRAMSSFGAMGIVTVIAALVTWAALSLVANGTGAASTTTLGSATFTSPGTPGSSTSHSTASSTTARPIASTTPSSSPAPTASQPAPSTGVATNAATGPGTVTKISLTCVRSADKVVATLTFESPTDIISMVRAGEVRTVTDHAAGQSTASAETSDLQATCLGVVGSRSIGPIPAT